MAMPIEQFSTPSDIVELSPTGTNERRYLGQECFKEINARLQLSGGRANRLPAANPNQKRRTLGLIEGDAQTHDPDLWSELVARVGEPKIKVFFLDATCAWKSIVRGNAFAYLMDVRGYPALTLSEGFGDSLPKVRLYKYSAMKRFRDLNKAECRCSINHIECTERPRPCPHQLGYRFLSRAMDKMWERIEDYCWRGEQ
jgi:hypothetical protein